MKKREPQAAADEEKRQREKRTLRRLVPKEDFAEEVVHGGRILKLILFLICYFIVSNR